MLDSGHLSLACHHADILVPLPLGALKLSHGEVFGLTAVQQRQQRELQVVHTALCSLAVRRLRLPSTKCKPNSLRFRKPLLKLPALLLSCGRIIIRTRRNRRLYPSSKLWRMNRHQSKRSKFLLRVLLSHFRWSGHTSILTRRVVHLLRLRRIGLLMTLHRRRHREFARRAHSSLCFRRMSSR